MSDVITNWAGNVTFAAELHRPTSVVELRRLVAGSERVRALGTGHSFNPLADSPGRLVSVAGLPRVLDVDREARTARVGAGLRYAEVGAALRRARLALPNTGSLPHISVAGSCATGTHGSGLHNPVLAAAVRSLLLIGPDGGLRTVHRDDADFDAYPVSLGRLGVAVELVLDLVPDFLVAQTVVRDADEAEVAADPVAVLAAAYSVSIFTSWGPDPAVQVWVKEKVGGDGAWGGEPRWGGWLADTPQHPIAGMPAEYATAQLGVPGPWNERLPHFREEFTPSAGEELQTEYLLPARHAADAWAAVSGMRARIAPVLQVSEVRGVAADGLWLSPTGGERSVAFHFTWVPDADAVRPVVEELEERLDGLDARPHWGKVFDTPPDRLAALYPRLGDFRRLVGEVDPGGKFGNDLVDGWLGLR